MYKTKQTLAFLTAFVILSMSTIMCQSNSQTESKLDLTHPDSTAKIFAEAFVSNDTTLFKRLLLNETEFEDFVTPWRSRRGAERGIKEFTDVWQDSKNQFRKARERSVARLQNTNLGKGNYRIMNSDIDPETGFIEFDFDMWFESNQQIGFRLYLRETANKLDIRESSSPSELTSVKNSRWKILGLRMN